MAAAAGLAAALVAAAPALLAVGAPAFAAALLAAALGLGLAVNAGRGGTGDWSAIFRLGAGGSFEAINEYLPGLPGALDYGTRVLPRPLRRARPGAAHATCPGTRRVCYSCSMHLTDLTTPGRHGRRCASGRRRAQSRRSRTLLARALVIVEQRRPGRRPCWPSASPCAAAVRQPPRPTRSMPPSALRAAWPARRPLAGAARAAGALLLAAWVSLRRGRCLAVGAWAAIVGLAAARGSGDAVALTAALCAAGAGRRVLRPARTRATGYDPDRRAAGHGPRLPPLASLRPAPLLVLGRRIAHGLGAGRRAADRARRGGRGAPGGAGGARAGRRGGGGRCGRLRQGGDGAHLAALRPAGVRRGGRGGARLAGGCGRCSRCCSHRPSPPRRSSTPSGDASEDAERGLEITATAAATTSGVQTTMVTAVQAATRTA